MARLQVFQTPFMDGGVVEFHSHTNPDHRGKGYNKILKGVLANLAEEEDMAKRFPVNGAVVAIMSCDLWKTVNSWHKH